MIARCLMLLIGLYQRTISRVTPPVCRFEPSCSHYAQHCLSHFGAFRGSMLAIRRIVRCHPFNPGGYDPPPNRLGTRPERHSPAGLSAARPDHGR